MERTINDVVREHEEQGEHSQWVRVCDCCGSENVHTAGDGGMGFCEDCDAPCTTITVNVIDEGRDVNADVGDYVRCCMCGIVVHIGEDTLGIRGSGWYCSMCE